MATRRSQQRLPRKFWQYLMWYPTKRVTHVVNDGFEISVFNEKKHFAKVTETDLNEFSLRSAVPNVFLTLKNPTTTTSSLSINALLASSESRSLAAGPVFLFNQLTMSDAWRPPSTHKGTHVFCYSSPTQNLWRRTLSTLSFPPA